MQEYIPSPGFSLSLVSPWQSKLLPICCPCLHTSPPLVVLGLWICILDYVCIRPLYNSVRPTLCSGKTGPLHPLFIEPPLPLPLPSSIYLYLLFGTKGICVAMDFVAMATPSTYVYRKWRGMKERGVDNGAWKRLNLSLGGDPPMIWRG